MNLKEVVVFLDDLIVFSDTLEEHEERYSASPEQVERVRPQVVTRKMSLFFLGHLVSEKGVETDPDKIAALTS